MIIRTHTAIGISVACLVASVLAWGQGREEQRPPDPRSRGGGDCRDNCPPQIFRSTLLGTLMPTNYALAGTAASEYS